METRAARLPCAVHRRGGAGLAESAIKAFGPPLAAVNCLRQLPARAGIAGLRFLRDAAGRLPRSIQVWGARVRLCARKIHVRNVLLHVGMSTGGAAVWLPALLSGAAS